MGNVWYFVYLREMSDVMSRIREKRPADVSVGRFVFWGGMGKMGGVGIIAVFFHWIAGEVEISKEKQGWFEQRGRDVGYIYKESRGKNGSPGLYC